MLGEIRWDKRGRCTDFIPYDDNILEAEKINNSELAEKTRVSRTTLEAIEKNGKARDDVYEKIYAYAYENKYRINSVKEELIKDKEEK